MSQLVLSLFPGGGMLDYAFECEGFTVVRGPDALWGGDIRRFHPPAGRFDGIIGGDPCQSHSSLANLVRAKGLTPRFPDLTGEYQRVVEEARPAWFLRENTPRAPWITPVGYAVRRIELDNCHLGRLHGEGQEQMRWRAFWFGVPGVAWHSEVPELRRWIDFALFELPEAQAVAADARPVPVAIGGSGKRKATAVGGNDGVCKSGQLTRRQAVSDGGTRQRRSAPVTGRNEGRVGDAEHDYSPPRRSLAEMLRLQGFPEDWLEHQPWTMQAKRRIVGNGVALPTGRALANAIRCWLEKEGSW